MTEERFICFYTPPPFWAGSAKPPFVESLPSALPQLYEQMSAVVLDETIANIRVRLSFDGFFELRKPGIEKRLHPPKQVIMKRDEIVSCFSEYLQIINALIVCLDIGFMESRCSSPFYFEELTRRDISRSTYVDSKFQSMSIPEDSIGGHYLSGRSPDRYRPHKPLSSDSRIYRRSPQPVDSIRVGLGHFETICRIPDMTEKLATFAKALSDFNAANYSTSVVLCWFLLERTLFERYKNFIKEKNDSGKHYISKKRRELLTSRDFTASIVSQMLELSGCISAIDLQHLDTIRKFRNDIAHYLKDKLPTAQECEAALDFTLKFVLEGIINEPRVNLHSDLVRQWP